MSFIAGAIDMLTSGGFTGILTGAIGAYTKIAEKKIDFKHRQFEMRYEIKMHSLQFKSDQFLAEQELLISKQAGADAAFTAAIEAEGRLTDDNLPWGIQACRTLFRPFLTLAMWTGVMIFAFTDVEVNTITESVAMTLQQGASAGTGFWFGSRAVGASPKR